MTMRLRGQETENIAATTGMGAGSASRSRGSVEYIVHLGVVASGSTKTFLL